MIPTTLLLRRGDTLAIHNEDEVMHRVGYRTIAPGSTARITVDATLLEGPALLCTFHASGALSKNNDDPTHASRPFDAKRDGFILGEGAGVLMLESEEHALARGARIYCELAGVGWSFDATDDTAPDPEGQALAMRRALQDAELTADRVDYINAHGTSTPYNDRTETEAIKIAFGEAARRVRISSTKSMTGHLAAGAGGIARAALCSNRPSHAGATR